MTQSDYDYLFKVVLVGNSSVGKTSLMQRFTDNHFDGGVQRATVGVQFEVVIVPLQSGKRAKLQIWDTAGQERFRAISTAYYRGANAIIIVFGVNDRKSFDDVRYWLSEVQQHHDGLSDKKSSEQFFSPEEEEEGGDVFDDSRAKAPRVYLFGNKSDLATERVVSYTEAEEYADSTNMIYQETSAAIGTGVHDAFLKMATTLEKQANAYHNMEIARERYILQKGTTLKLHEEEQTNPTVVEKKCQC